MVTFQETYILVESGNLVLNTYRLFTLEKNIKAAGLRSVSSYVLIIGGNSIGFLKLTICNPFKQVLIHLCQD